MQHWTFCRYWFWNPEVCRLLENGQIEAQIREGVTLSKILNYLWNFQSLANDARRIDFSWVSRVLSTGRLSFLYFFWSIPFVQLLAKVLFEDGVRQCVPHDWVQHLQNKFVLASSSTTPRKHHLNFRRSKRSVCLSQWQSCMLVKIVHLVHCQDLHDLHTFGTALTSDITECACIR